MKLLIADDDRTFRTMLATITRRWGYDPLVVEDGQQAWEILQNSDAPRLLLMDREMPKLDGVELCRRIHQCSSDNPPYSILLTVHRSTGSIVAGLRAGANDYITKPFVNAELRARLQVGQRILELQGKLNQAQNVLTHEREIIENIILKMRSSKPFEEECLRKLESPVEKTSGDVLLSAYRADKTRHVMLGDFTGHGLMAAVAGPIVYDVFYSMTAKGLSLQEIAVEINRQLLEKMPTGLFLGAVFIELSPDRRLLRLWNCGMSDILIYRKAKLLQKINSSLLALGIVEQEFALTATIDVENDDRVYAYSDGITETVNSEGNEFGQYRLEHVLSELLLSDADIEFLSDVLRKFRGKASQSDDITLVELIC